MVVRARTALIDQLSFAGKRVMVTGAGSGIGRAICARFDEAGAHLMMIDSDARGLTTTLASLNGTGHEQYVVDLERKANIDSLWARLTKGTSPDVLVNNAGIYPMRDFLEVDQSYLQRTLDINLNASFWMCQHFIRLRGSLGGVIVNTSSVEAILPFKEDMVHYSISKAGVLALTRSLAGDYGGKGFRTNAVIPGAITTPGTQALVKNALLRLSFKLAKTGYLFQQRLANRRWGYPDDVAKVVLFLSSDLASYVQGAAVPVDGGFLSS